MKVQGDFGSKEEADRAVEACKAAGIAASRIRSWNVLGEKKNEPPPQSAVGRAAFTGYLIGGTTGAAVGAALGSLGGSKDAPMADPVGVRVVVEAGDPDPEPILRDAGARNIQRTA